ncbi:MAG: formylglycine-generating enzyme family protein [Acidobacteria bacterium]|nr:formylglycine-generating enzyme family protein [Acidobacteriota bacterium]
MSRKNPLTEKRLALALSLIIPLLVLSLGFISWTETTAGSTPSAAAAGDTVPPAPAAFTNEFGMDFVYLPPGEFMMGSDQGAPNERPVHRVQITRGYYLQTTELTQRQWTAVMGTRPWEAVRHAPSGPDYPAVGVSWEDARAFVAALSEKSGRTYRLPTEAEWEYACRAGTTTEFYYGDERSGLGDYGWYVDNTVRVGLEHAQPVARKKPNAWGLYDMHGNVWEWCADHFSEDYYARSPLADPAGPESGYPRVLRGGAYDQPPRYCRSAIRIKYFADNSYAYIGFRILAEAE